MSIRPFYSFALEEDVDPPMVVVDCETCGPQLPQLNPTQARCIVCGAFICTRAEFDRLTADQPEEPTPIDLASLARRRANRERLNRVS